MTDDPYFQVKEEVEAALAEASQLLANWKRLRTSGDGRELQWTADELQAALRALDDDLADLDESVRIAQTNPARFRLDARDLAARKDFVARARRAVADARAALAAPPPIMPANPAAASRLRSASALPESSAAASSSSYSSSSLQPKRVGQLGAGASDASRGAPPRRGQSDRDLLLRATGSSSSSSPVVVTDRFGRTMDDYRASNQRFIDREQGMQQEILRHQDTQLEGVMDTVGNLKEVAVVMNREMEDQAA
ncbi:Syntaxin-6 [Cladochytrium tenue]|nr:Syntaxin-6 [Cladochytrium tenue]